MVTSKRRTVDRAIDSWEEMKSTIRKRFVPSHYYRDIFNRLQRLRQGFRSVEEYFQEMEVILIRVGVDEDCEATMARFLSGFNRDIARQVELKHYVNIEEMVDMAVAVEKQIKMERLLGNLPFQSRMTNLRLSLLQQVSNLQRLQP